MRLRIEDWGLGIALAAVILAAFMLPGCGEPDHRRHTAYARFFAGGASSWRVNIATTVFWVGEKGNESSAWCGDWVRAYGGVDDPKKRDGFHPTGFTPKENPFYCALPFKGPMYARDDSGPLRLSRPQDAPNKNRWIEIEFRGRRCYAQWEDVGPYRVDDYDYVFGGKPPKAKAGLDVSPAVRDHLGLSGRDVTRWRFVDEKDVPAGPWRKIVTTSGPNWR